MKIEITCDYCGKSAMREVGHVNRARRQGDKLFCDRYHAGLGRRKNKSKEQKAEEKRLYDIIYRARPEHKAQRSAEFKRNYNPEKAAIKRALIKKERPEIEVKRREYMALPKYKSLKHKYDRRYLAEKNYGDYAECQLLLMDIDKNIRLQASDYEIRLANGTLNRLTKRKRDYAKKINSTRIEEIPVGNLERA